MRQDRPFSYLCILPGLVKVAHVHGYSLSVHGSLQRDFDLIACPWVEVTSDAETLVKALAEHVGGALGTTSPDVGKTYQSKPHGRKSWSILLGPTDCYIDISVMPTSTP